MSFLQKKIFDFYGSTFGVDLSDLSVKAVQLEREGKRDRIVSYGLANIAPGNITDGEIINKDKVAAAIKEMIKNSAPKKIKAKKVICSLPETKAFLRIINIPKMKKEEVQEAVKWEMEANIPISIDQAYYDWNILDRNFDGAPDKMSVLVAAVSKKIIEQFVEVFELAGLEAVDMEIESIAQARSLLNSNNEQETAFIVDIGSRRTSFFAAVGNTPCFTSSIPISNQSLSDAIAGYFNISSEEAERIRVNYGIGSMVISDPVFSSVEPILENLATEMKKFMDFYLAGLKYSSSIDRIVLCGSGAATKGIIPYLSSKVKREIEMGNPWTNLNLMGTLPVISKEKSAKYSTAVGLALKGLCARQ
jgi:type IV pilus assembly protein PilM